MGMWPTMGITNTQLGTFSFAEAEVEREHERAMLREEVAATEDFQAKLAQLTDIYSQVAEQLEELRREADEDREQALKKLGEIERMLTGFTALQNQSAGGVVPLRGAKMTGVGRAVDDALGWPAATGDIRLTHNNAPPGWLTIGTERYDAVRDEYRELHEVLRDAYGPAAKSAWFRLPKKSDLTNDPAILDNPNIRFIIRT